MTQRVRVIARLLVTLPRCVSNRRGINEIYRSVNKPRSLRNYNESARSLSLLNGFAFHFLSSTIQ